MSLEYRFDYVHGRLGNSGPEVAIVASDRGSEGWRLVSVNPGAEGWALFFERPVAKGKPLSPAEWPHGFIADAPPLEVPSAIGCPPSPGWREEFQKMIRDQGARLALLEQIIRRRDEVVELARKGQCCHCGTNLVASFVGPLDRLDAEESHDPR